MAEALTTLSNLVTFTFVVSTMLLAGVGLTLAEMTKPLRSARVVIQALVANFVVVPLVAVGILRLLPLDPDHEVGLVLLGVAAGAPFLPKLAELAKVDVPFAAALMALLIVASVIYLPISLPLLLPGVQVDGAGIALSLLLTILAPLGLGVFVRWRWTNDAHKVVPALKVVSDVSLVALLVLMLGLNVGKVLGMFGSGSILAVVVLTVVASAAGYLLGGPRRDTRLVLAFGTGQRNMAACFIIANANFGDRPQVLVLLAAASVISMLLVMPVATMLGRRGGGLPEPVAGRANTAAGQAADGRR